MNFFNLHKMLFGNKHLDCKNHKRYAVCKIMHIGERIIDKSIIYSSMNADSCQSYLISAVLDNYSRDKILIDNYKIMSSYKIEEVEE